MWPRPSRSSAGSTAIDQLIQLGKTAQRLIIDQGDVDGRPGFRIRLSEAAIRERQDFAISQNTLTLRNRVNELGVAEAVVQRRGSIAFWSNCRACRTRRRRSALLGSTATLEFHLVDNTQDAAEAERRGRAPLGLELKKMKDGRPYCCAATSSCRAISSSTRPRSTATASPSSPCG
jgi:preprotein translocase subunit SecD